MSGKGLTVWEGVVITSFVLGFFAHSGLGPIQVMTQAFTEFARSIDPLWSIVVVAILAIAVAGFFIGTAKFGVVGVLGVVAAFFAGIAILSCPLLGVVLLAFAFLMGGAAAVKTGSHGKPTR